MAYHVINTQSSLSHIELYMIMVLGLNKVYTMSVAFAKLDIILVML